jgi:integrase
MYHLMLIADQLYDLGFQGMKPRSLKQKHVDALVKDWLRRELAVGTIKNRMAVLRWWAEKAHRRNVVARSNAYYGIPDRLFVTNTSKAKEVSRQDLEKISDPYVRLSLELQRAFGLRREEAIKFIPSLADRGDHITLKSTWTKGGKERDVPIRTDEQREVLKWTHKLAGNGALIPGERNYVQQLRLYERQTTNAGLSKLHGLRHAYAQVRYEELTGWKAPAAGGPIVKALSPGQRVMDRQARRTISQELGHVRTQISSVYLGK